MGGKGREGKGKGVEGTTQQVRNPWKKIVPASLACSKRQSRQLARRSSVCAASVEPRIQLNVSRKIARPTRLGLDAGGDMAEGKGFIQEGNSLFSCPDDDIIDTSSLLQSFGGLRA